VKRDCAQFDLNPEQLQDGCGSVLKVVEPAPKERSPAASERPIPHRLGLPYHIIQPTLAIADAVLIVLSAIIGGGAFQLSIGLFYGDPEMYAGIGLICAVSYAVCARHANLYSIETILRERRDYLDILTGWGLVILFLSVIFFLLKLGTDISRGSVSSFCVLGCVVLVLWRKLVKHTLRVALLAGAIRGRKTAIIGSTEELARIRRDFLLYHYGAEEIERIVLGKGSEEPDASLMNGVIDRIRSASVDQIMLALDWSDRSKLELVRQFFRVFPLPVRLIPDRSMREVLKYSESAEHLLIDLQREPLSRLEQFSKRAIDLAVAIVSLVVLSPLMIVTAGAIAIQGGGPIVFRQRRMGFNNQVFSIYKFRTMRVTEDGPSVSQARKNDSRVTPLGRILRRTSIDELPQLFNVLRGDMSIVGPRPHAVAHDDKYGLMIAEYAFRRHVKPGITGWAQVNGFRGETLRLEQMSKRVELDLWYINNWSLALDLHIMARTAFELARARNAY